MAVVVTAALVAAPTEHRPLPDEAHQVQLVVAVVSAAGNAFSLESVAPQAVSEYPRQPVAFATEAKEAVPAAAAEGDSFLDSPLGTVLALANFVALPLWFLFTPITLPLSMLAGASTITMDGAFGTLQFLIATGLTFITGPLGLLTIFLRSATSAAAEVPGTGRSNAPEATPVPAAVTTSASTAAPVEDELDVASAKQSAKSTGGLTRGRLPGRTVGTSPRAAAVVSAEAPAVADPEAASLSVREVAEAPGASSVPAADPTSSSSEGPSPKSRATLSSRR